jgi:hypothetical protein
MEVSGHIHDPAALPPAKSLRYQFSWKLGGPHSPYGQFAEKKNLWPKRYVSSVVHPVA